MIFAFNKSVRTAQGKAPIGVLLIACLLLNALTFSATHCVSHQEQDQAELCSLHKPMESGKEPTVEAPLVAQPFFKTLFSIEQAFIHIAAPFAIYPARAPPIPHITVA